MLDSYKIMKKDLVGCVHRIDLLVLSLAFTDTSNFSSTVPQSSVEILRLGLPGHGTMETI